MTEGPFSDPALTKPLLKADHAGRMPGPPTPLRQHRPGHVIASRNPSTHQVEARDEVSDSVRLKGATDERMTIGARAASKLLVTG